MSAREIQSVDPTFGEWVRTRRRALDLTQDELARRVSCARVTIRKIESDELIPSKELAQVLAEKLGVPAQERDQFVKYGRSGKQPELITAQTTDIPPWHDEKRRHNLPESVTTFVGREREMAEIKKLLSTFRLLTLTGSGGVGKTRLALHVAADLRDAQWDEVQDKPRPYRDGVWFIELAPLSDPSLVPTTIANVLGVREEQERSLIATLSDWLRDKHLLLILDNCEHLIEAGAQFADAVLRTSHDVRILATSRETLGIAGETAYRVPSLAMPDPKNMPPLETLSQSESVRLFIERAQAAQPKFALAEGNALAVAQLCHQLDGIPLALELAAARVQAFSVEQINERLDDRFRLLTGGSRTALPRQQTLRALVDWSYDLLSESERMLLRRLSVFAGGWTLEAAESVCGEQDGESGQTTVPTNHRLFSGVLETLARLVDKSLVVVNLQAKEPRYHLLETIRQYAREKLLDANESEPLRDRHLDFFLKLAEQSESLYYEGQLFEWIPRLEVEHDNLRAALEWACGRDPEKARWLAGLLRWFWLYAEHLHEARTWYARVLKSGERASKTKELATALLGAAVSAAGLEEHGEARSFLEESVALYRELGDETRLAEALVWLGNSTLILGHDANACALYEENESLIRKSARRATLASGLVVWARAIANARHDYTFAKALLEESIAIRRASKNSFPLGLGAFLVLGYIATARRLCRGTPVSIRIAGRGAEAWNAFCDRGCIEKRRGCDESAGRLSQRAAVLRRSINNAPRKRAPTQCRTNCLSARLSRPASGRN